MLLQSRRMSGLLQQLAECPRFSRDPQVLVVPLYMQAGTDMPRSLELSSGLPRPRPGREDPGLVVLTGEDLSGQKASTRDMRKMPARRKKQIDPLELKAGDYVVHEQHGVGRFVEMMQRDGAAARPASTSSSSTAPPSAASPPTGSTCPTDQLDQVTRYVGGEQPTPRPARRRRLGQAQGPGPQGGPRDRGRADQAVRRPAGHPGPRVRPGHPVAARARGRLPVRTRRPTS